MLLDSECNSLWFSLVSYVQVGGRTIVGRGSNYNIRSKVERICMWSFIIPYTLVARTRESWSQQEITESSNTKGACSLDGWLIREPVYPCTLLVSLLAPLWWFGNHHKDICPQVSLRFKGIFSPNLPVKKLPTFFNR